MSDDEMPERHTNASPWCPPRNAWLLAEGIRFLNHGAFGATPVSVLEEQSRIRAAMERAPVRFMLDELPGLLFSSADALGRFIGAAGQDIAFLSNATEGINGVLWSFDWRPGDELVIANHAYPAVRNAAKHIAARFGAVVVEVRMPFPVEDSEELIAAYLEALSPRTRMVVVDHVVSALGLVMPVRKILNHCRQRGIAVLVDGAHGPGMLELNLEELDADWYVGNGHKWLLSAKGCAFVRTAPWRQSDTHPPVLSNFYGSPYPSEFHWTGTRDYSAWASLPAALEFIVSMGAERYRGRLRELAIEAGRELAQEWNVEFGCPVDCIGAMVTLPLPGRPRGSAEDGLAIRRRLLTEHRIEVPVFAIDGVLHARISAQVYCEIEDFQALGRAVLALALS